MPTSHPKKLYAAIALILIIIAIAGLMVYLYHTDAPDSRSLSQTDLKHVAWQTFDQYRRAAKSHDLKTVTALSYQLSDACKNSASSTDCFAKMDVVASSTKDFNESDFTTMWYDDKQIVMLSDWQKAQSDIAYAYGREDLFFTRDSLGNPKVLFVTLPQETVYTLKKHGETVADWTRQLDKRITDTDMDGSADEVENCSYPNAPASCMKTDPAKRDTDGNGWWDSTESFFYKKPTS